MIARQPSKIKSPAEDLLTAEKIRTRLTTRIMGVETYSFRQTRSTNDLAFHLAEQGAAEGTLVIAESQKKGRGRFGRCWISPPGGLWFSLILRPYFFPSLAPRITITASLAVASTIRQLTPLPALIRWPNDILIKGKKVSGIITEMNAETEVIKFIILGIGVNLNLDATDFPPEIRNMATSIRQELGYSLSRVDFLVTLLGKIEKYYLELKAGRFFSILQEWCHFSATLGRQVKVNTPEGPFEGYALNIDDDGALVLRLDSGFLKRILTGDVTFISFPE